MLFTSYRASQRITFLVFSICCILKTKYTNVNHPRVLDGVEVHGTCYDGHLSHNSITSMVEFPQRSVDDVIRLICRTGKVLYLSHELSQFGGLPVSPIITREQAATISRNFTCPCSSIVNTNVLQIKEIKQIQVDFHKVLLSLCIIWVLLPCISWPRVVSWPPLI